MRIFSGIQPTGRKHLGNYIGAIRQYVAGQDRGDAIYCIVDLHAVSVAYEPADLRRYLYDTTAILLSAGLDPNRSILFRQSDVQEHTELCWLLCAVTAHGELNRMTQFKDKSAKQKDLVSAALFFYPVLQAADILAYKTNEVPVGDDQRQHIELTRNIAERFNERFGDTLVVPRHNIPEVGARIMDLAAPDQKMSTSASTDQGTVYVLDEPKAVLKKIKSAVTDSGTEIRHAPDKPGIANLLEIMAAIQNKKIAEVEQAFAGARYGDLKVAVAEAVVAYLAPVRERYLELRPDEARLEEILSAGAERARRIASATVAEVKDRMGVGPKPARS
ncbi:MAG: tryptophan--tRNA ligase [Polyangiaceae bacterium]|nr:tryptophan--tRNA ligase [Polyangiaceae bacterium]